MQVVGIFYEFLVTHFELMIQYEWLGVLLRRSGSPGDHGFSYPVMDHESDVLVANCESVR